MSETEPTNPPRPESRAGGVFAAMEGIGTAIVAAGTILAAVAGIGAAHWRLGALERWQDTHTAETAKRNDVVDATTAALKDQSAVIRETADHRITELEGSFKAIQGQLSDLQTTTHDLDRKVDDLGAKRR